MTSKDSTRAGRYEKQSQGFRAFNPEPLPPNPRIRLTGTLLNALSQAEHSLARLNGSILTLPDSDKFVSMYMRHEAVLSSTIDGADIRLLDLIAAEARISTSKRSTDMQEIQNYISVMERGHELFVASLSLTSSARELHRQILQHKNESNLNLGEFRTKQSWIGPAGCTVHDATFVPPPPELVNSQMQALDEFFATDIGLPPLVKIGLIHAQFENIHPFLNGNGRVNRLLLALLLYKRKLVEKPVLNLSWFFNRNNREYHDRLQSVREDGNWEDWLLFFLKAVIQVGKHAAITVRRILETREENRQMINNNLGRLAASAHRLLDRLYEFPFVSVNEVRDLTGTTFASANALVVRMVECGLLREYTQRHRNRRYLFYSYVELFKER
ncbi:MAG: Fic family protein [Gammaproteobacteria bacterium]|nr:Fic family protein [Gammaproteobacteria bacterium]MYF03023.1 Fic family protein [Gammaproteobacteria bacterium]MYI77210.1 Fic family protein [Gammaproteobacteria bacterium]